eukprot:846422-Pleurochrysis_carterae.AAC.2
MEAKAVRTDGVSTGDSDALTGVLCTLWLLCASWPTSWAECVGELEGISTGRGRVLPVKPFGSPDVALANDLAWASGLSFAGALQHKMAADGAPGADVFGLGFVALGCDDGTGTGCGFGCCDVAFDCVNCMESPLG